MPIRIRQLRPGDALLVARADPLFDDPTSLTAAAAYLRDPSNVFFLASDGDTPVGFLRGTSLRQLKSTQRQMFLYEIAVDPAFHRRGIGRALIERFLRYCHRQGFEEAFVFTDPGNRPAVGLYASTGAVTETPADRMFVYRLTAGARPAPRRASARAAPRMTGRRRVRK